MQQKAPSEVDSLAAFDADWDLVAQEILQERAQVQKALARAKARIPVSVLAMAQQSLQSVEPYLQSAHPFARTGGVASARRYIGRAREHLEFAKFCTTMSSAEPACSIDPVALEEEMIRIEARVRSIFPKTPAGSDLETVLLETNSRFNAARDLIASGQMAGAWLTVLEAGFELAALEFEDPLPSAAQLQVLCEDWYMSMGDMGDADSIDVMLLQYAGILVADGEGTRMDRRIARTILEDGLPTRPVR
jgi:hypothetical protein